MAKRIPWTTQAGAEIRGIEPPLIRLRAQDCRVCFRDKGDYPEVSRVLHRREAYRRDRVRYSNPHR
jgi:hypothetical protein